MSEKTVFLSYRRDAVGRAFAGRICDGLIQNGYDVFMDVDTLEAGEWKQQIFSEIISRSHFILVLTPGCLERCKDENDVLRQEFEQALQANRNIVPVREESIDPGLLKQATHESMQYLFDLDMPVLRHNSFREDIKTLITRYIPKRLGAARATSDFRKSLNEAKNLKSRVKISAKHFKTMIDQLLNLFILTAVILFIINMEKNDSWIQSYLVVAAVSAKGFWLTLVSSKETATFAYISLIMIATGMTLLIYKSKNKNHDWDALSAFGFSCAFFGLGLAISLLFPKFPTKQVYQA